MHTTSRLEAFSIALSHYWWTGSVILLALIFSGEYVKQHPSTFRIKGQTGEAYNNWDGQWYQYVATKGYFYDAKAPSSVAFFPAYPMICRAFSGATGVGIGYSLVIVSNILLLITYFLLALYVQSRYGPAGPRIANLAVISFSILPTAFFYRMGYTESMFSLIVISFLYLMHRNGNLLLIAALAGLATATRSVGVALLFPLMLHVWRRQRDVGRTARVMCLIGPVAVWGLVAYMAYLHFTFDNALAFAEAQNRFKNRPSPPFFLKLYDLVSLEPIRELLTPSSIGYWKNWERNTEALFSLHLADPIIFASAVSLTIYGFWRHIINSIEFALALALILVPYATIGCETYMRSQGRYSSAAIPIYLVMGTLLDRAPAPVATACCAVSCVIMFVYSCMFLSGYMLI